MLAFLTVAAAAPSDEIVVYGDPWARWRRTRWLVATDLVLPLGVTFAADENRAFTTHELQLRAVLACDLEGEPAKRRAEVGCAIEDIAILPTSLRDWVTEDQRARVDDVLQEVDERLTGLVVQLQVDAAGGITDYDLEGLDADDLRERRSAEAMRQVVSRVVSAFHLRLPDDVEPGQPWTEYHSGLFAMDSLAGSRGSSILVHRVRTVDGHVILESVGEGSAAITLPSYTRQLVREPPALADPRHGVALQQAARERERMGDAPFTVRSPDTPLAVPLANAGAGIAPPTLQPPQPDVVAGGNSLVIEGTYTLEAAAVAYMDDGILVERVWVVVGTPTPSSLVQAPYGLRGELRRLAPDEHPDLGPSAQVAYPGADMEGLPPYPVLR